MNLESLEDKRLKQLEEMTEQEIADEKKLQKQLDMARAFKTVFNSVDGRKVLKELMRSCHFFTPNKTMHEGSVLFTEGKRSVILDIMGALEKNEEEIFEIFTKRNNEIDEEDDL